MIVKICVFDPLDIEEAVCGNVMLDLCWDPLVLIY